MSNIESRALAVLNTPGKLYEIPEPLNAASLIDHTLLKPQATSQHIKKLCEEATEFGFASVCVNPVFVPLAAKLLQDTPVRIGTVVGFPLGATGIAMKVHEAQEVTGDGAREIDMVANIGAIKSGDYAFAQRDIQSVVEACPAGTVVKVIIETALLTDEEKAKACLLSLDAGAHFVKTSTGFASGGAVAADVAIMRRAVGDGAGVKAAGGIRTLDHVRGMMQAGATRIGTSAGVQILGESG